MDISKYVKTLTHSPQARTLALKSARTFRPINKVAHRYGPEILTGTGILGGVGTVVLASRATLRLEEIVDHTRSAIEHAENPKEAHKARLDGLIAIGKLYAPAATLGVASTGAILGAHGIMRRRNVALIAAYKAIETSFHEYRKRVIETYGEDIDKDFRYGFKDIERKNKDGEKETITTVTSHMASPYARFFDETNPEWSKTPEFNLAFLLGKQAYANQMLQAKGHLFLNDVYKELGFEVTKLGQVTGWLREDATKNGDGYVDFGIFDLNNQQKRNFVNGHERSVILDFNVDGNILDRI